MSLTENVENITIRESALKKISIRILPWLSLLYLMAVLDRTNLSNAHFSLIKKELSNTNQNDTCTPNCTLTPINQSRGVYQSGSDYGFLSEEEFGFSVGIFFLSYMIFEIPSNILLKKTGAPVWLSRIMVSWGIVTICTIFVKNGIGLIICRFLLGATEAGFWPGTIYYLSTWYSKTERGIRIGLFYLTSPFSGVIGGILSYGILQMDGILGLFGWQWLFLLEGIPSVLLGILTYFILPTNPNSCTFLTPEEKEWVLNSLTEDQHPQQLESDPSKISMRELIAVFKNWRVWMFCILSLGHNCMGSIVGFFIPSIINRFGDNLSPLNSNLLSAGPFLFGVICILINSRHSDYTKERPLHLLIPFSLQILGWALVGISFFVSHNLAFQYTMLILTVGVHFTFVPIFWAWLTQELTGGTTLAVSTAFVASFGTIGSIITPSLTTFILYNLESYLWVMIILASFGFLCLLMGILLANLLKRYPLVYDRVGNDVLQQIPK